MGQKGEGGGVDQELVRALAHPLRVRVLEVLEKGPSSPKRIADELDVRLGNVSYHVGVLAECGCIELVDRRQARGAVEHFYRVKPERGIGSGAWKAVPASLRGNVAADAFNAFSRRAIEALQADTVESRQASGVTWMSLSVDETGWEELLRILEDVEVRFRAVVERSAARLEKDLAGVAIPAVVAVVAFEMPQGEAGSR
jgi:DNA-binding transcriptional ArsR family regulator